MKREKPIRVLIAEDEFLVGKEITRILKDIGYEQIGIAQNGEKAVEMTRSLHPDIVLMDIKMPKLDGLQAARQILEACPTPVIILTAHESKEFFKKASETGVVAYITKPPSKIEIERAVTIALARHQDLLELQHLNRDLKSHKEELEKKLAEIKTLKGLLPICAKCKKIRDDKGYWNLIETYIEQHSEAFFSHGMCPNCSEELYGDQDWYIDMKKKKNNKKEDFEK